MSVRLAPEWRPVADGPNVSERISEAALAVCPPRLLVVFEFRAGAGARADRALHEAVWVIDEQLDPRARDAKPVRAVLRWVLRVDLVEEERSAVDLKAGHAPEVPELGRAERLLVP